MGAPVAWLGRALTSALGRRGPFVLCYHGVGEVTPESDPHGLFVSRELFTRHLDAIEEHGYRLLTVSELWRQLERDPQSRHIGAISFDDGLVKTVREAMPILHERKMPSSMYVPSGLLGGPHPDMAQESIISNSELVDLAASGVEVGAHTVDHLMLTELSYSEMLDQLSRSRLTLGKLLSAEVSTMAYPFGALDEQTIRAASESGYETACGCSGPGPWQALNIPREPVFPATNTRRLTLKMTGLYGPVHRARKLQSKVRGR